MITQEEAAIRDEDFSFFKEFLKKQSGYILQDEKRYLLESRIRKTLSEQKLDNVGELVKALNKTPHGALAQEFIEAMTINETLFFRDQRMFDSLVQTVLPELMAAGRRQLRFWSAAASSGQEAYSIAMMCEEHKARWGMDYSIVATDINLRILERARHGIYNAFEVKRGLSDYYLSTYFNKVAEGWQIKETIRNKVTFSQRNLKDSFAALGQFDVVLLRNVLIYFDDALKADILARIHPVLKTPGYLALGGTESIAMLQHPFARFADSTGFYKKTAPT